MQFAASVGGQDDDRRALRRERAEFGDRDRRLSEELEQQRLELVVSSVDLVDEQYRRSRASITHRLQDWPFKQECLGEQIGVRDGFCARLRESNREQLPLVVPLVQRFADCEPFVTL